MADFFLNREQLLRASAAGDTDRVMSLIDRGVDIHSSDHGATALHYACENGHTAVASLLLERGADIHSRDNNGRTALYYACSTGHTAVASLLLERGVDIHSRDNCGATALHRACESGPTALVSLLLQRGADVHSRGNGGRMNGGRTALHKACTYGHKDIAILLIERGADIDIKDYNGYTALHGPLKSALRHVVAQRARTPSLPASSVARPQVSRAHSEPASAPILVHLPVRGAAATAAAGAAAVAREVARQEPQAVATVLQPPALPGSAAHDSGSVGVEPDLCVACLDRRKVMVALPCSHLLYCEHCRSGAPQESLRHCAVCRKPVTSYMKIYI